MKPLADFILEHVQYRLPQHWTSYVGGVSPLSTHSSVATALISYLTIIYKIRSIMKNQRAKELGTLFQIHNIVVVCGSLALLILILEEILPILWSRGLFSALYAKESWTSRLEFYYMINYYFKYFELIDTVFLVLKKKQLLPNVFHHPATVLLVFIQLNGRPSCSWAVISLNLATHVVTYCYYYKTAGGARFKWKKYLTILQIVQFVIDLFVINFAMYQHMAAAYYTSFPHLGDCATSDFSVVFSGALITIFLSLLTYFYFKTYEAPAKSASNGIVNVQADGKAKGHGMGMLLYRGHGKSK